ncbi:MAG: prepilin-type N-terminal cleavage/methylation domain-containing protein [Verrucomicrobiota bacterium]
MQAPTPSRSRQRGFTLAEILAVMVIIGILISMSGPALRALSGSAEAERQVERFGDFLSTCRTEAIGRNTYVWVGIDNFKTDANSDQIRATSFFSKDGTAYTTGQSGAAHSNVGSLGITTTVDDYRLVTSLSELEPITQETVQGIAAEGNEFSLFYRGWPETALPKANGEHYNYLLVFTPSGELSLYPDIQAAVTGGFQGETLPSNLYLQLYLQRTQAGIDPAKETMQDAVIDIRADQGNVEVYLP